MNDCDFYGAAFKEIAVIVIIGYSVTVIPDDDSTLAMHTLRYCCMAPTLRIEYVIILTLMDRHRKLLTFSRLYLFSVKKEKKLSLRCKTSWLATFFFNRVARIFLKAN